MTDNATQPKVSVIIPVYNEGAGVGPVCSGVREALASMGEGAVEIIVVDDASTDGALKECPAGADRLIRHRRNRGYGAAIKNGVRHSRGETVVIIDADGTYDPADIPKLLGKMSHGTRMVVGARTGASVAIPMIRKPAKWLLGKLANYLSGVRIPDLNSGLRAIGRKEFDLFAHLLPEGFSLTTTITLAFLCDGREIAFVPIDYAKRRDGASKIRPIRDTYRILLTILRTVTYFNPLKIFLPMCATLGILAVVVLVASWAHGQIMDGTVAVLAMASIQSLAFGLLADAITRSGRAQHE